MYKRTRQFYEFGSFRLDLRRRLLFRQDQVIPLTPKVLHTLLVLVENSGRIVSKDELMKAVWPDTFVEEGNLTQNISTLRKVLGENAGDHIYIETIPKQGYRFIAGSLTETETETAAPPWLRRHRGLIWAGLIPVVLAIAAVTGWHFRPQSNVAKSLTVTPLTSDTGLELHPSLAPDGNQVAFAWDGEKRDNLDIYVKVVGTDRSMRLTFDPAQDFRPAWSPDGRWIAFLRATDGRKASIMRIPPTGGPEQKVAAVDPGDMASFDRAPLLEWTPDGKWLLTRERVPPDYAASLFLISMESGEKKRLTFPPPVGHGDLTAEISVDGRTLAFSRTRSGTLGKLCTQEMSSGYTPAGEPNCFAISDPRLANFGSIRWTPNRPEVMFSPLFRGSGQSSLWTMPLPQREGAVGVPQRFPIPSDSARDPAISRDGRRLVYSDFRVDVDIWRLDLRNAGAGPVKLITSTKFDHAGEFSPDGKKIVFISNRSGHPAVWVADNDGSNQTRLTTREFPLAGMPRWSPDGQRIVFDSTLDGHFELYLINADGSGLRNLTQHPAQDAVASWSRDGRWIYFASSRGGGENQIWKMPSDGGEPTQLTTHGGHTSSRSIDGKFLYHAKWVAGRPGLWRIPVSGGDGVKVLDSISPLNFAVADSGIYFIAGTAYGSSIQFLNFQTGKVTPITRVDGPHHPGLSVSPDGRFLLYSYAQIISSDLMLAENFR